MFLGRMGFYDACRQGMVGAGALADAANDAHPIQLADAGRRCANKACGKLLSRLNRDTLCFACQRQENEAYVRASASPMNDREALQADRRRRQQLEERAVQP